MTSSPADILAAARNNPVGPYLPVTWDLLAKIGEWIGPAECFANGFMVRDHVDRWDIAPLDMCVAYVQSNEGDEVVPERIRLDTRRAEVRHLLVDLGIAPEWARGSAVACWCAGMGVPDTRLLRSWSPYSGKSDHRADSVSGNVVLRCGTSGFFYAPGWDLMVRPTCTGPETGDLGRACADLAALRARCILAEKDGLYVPLADGGIGWWGHG